MPLETPNPKLPLPLQEPAGKELLGPDLCLKLLIVFSLKYRLVKDFQAKYPEFEIPWIFKATKLDAVDFAKGVEDYAIGRAKKEGVALKEGMWGWHNWILEFLANSILKFRRHKTYDGFIRAVSEKSVKHDFGERMFENMKQAAKKSRLPQGHSAYLKRLDRLERGAQSLKKDANRSDWEKLFKKVGMPEVIVHKQDAYGPALVKMAKYEGDKFDSTSSDGGNDDNRGLEAWLDYKAMHHAPTSPYAANPDGFSSVTKNGQHIISPSKVNDDAASIEYLRVLQDPKLSLRQKAIKLDVSKDSVNKLIPELERPLTDEEREEMDSRGQGFEDVKHIRLSILLERMQAKHRHDLLVMAEPAVKDDWQLTIVPYVPGPGIPPCLWAFGHADFVREARERIRKRQKAAMRKLRKKTVPSPTPHP